MEVHGQLLEPRPDPAEFLQPADALLDDVPPAVRDAVEPDRRVVPGLLVVPVGDHPRRRKKSLSTIRYWSNLRDPI
jgi:hypothetical protein